MAYRITGLDPNPYRSLFELGDDELVARGCRRLKVTDVPGFPCRASLVDRPIGDWVLLTNHVSNDVANPYRASHAIFIAEQAEQAEFIDCLPPVFESRLLSLRGFDSDGMMADALVVQPGEVEAGIERLLADPRIASIHAHNAVRGCFSARIERN